MTLELRGMKMTDGSLMPYYRLPHTLAQLNAALDLFPQNNQLYRYQPSSPGRLLAAPYLDSFQRVAREVLSGGNALGYLTPRPASAMRFLTLGTELPTGPTINHSPGSTAWFDSATYDRHLSTGTITPTGSWNNTDLIGVRPFPGEGFMGGTSTGLVFPSFIIETSDGYGRRLSWSAIGNVVGWQFMAINGDPTTLPPGMPDKIDGLASVLIKELKDEDPTMVRYNPRLQTSNVGCYVLTKADLNEFMVDLWTTTAIESIQKAFIGDGSNALLGLRWFYGLAEAIETRPIESHITLGNVPFDTKAPVPVNEFIVYDFGSIATPAYFGDYRDWTEVVYKMYLPFIGIIELNPADILGKTLYLKYSINLTDGSAVCTLSTTATTPNGTGTIFTTTTSWGYDIPIKVDPIRDAMSLTGSIVSSVLPAVAGGAAGGMLSQSLIDKGGQSHEVSGGVGGALAGLMGTSAMAGQSYSTGSLSPNSNVMADFSAKLVTYRKTDLTGDLATAAGAPSGRTGTVGSFSGFVKASVVYNGGSLPMRQAGKIIALLQEGIYI